MKPYIFCSTLIYRPGWCQLTSSIAASPSAKQRIFYLTSFTSYRYSHPTSIDRYLIKHQSSLLQSPITLHPAPAVKQAWASHHVFVRHWSPPLTSLEHPHHLHPQAQPKQDQFFAASQPQRPSAPTSTHQKAIHLPTPPSMKRLLRPARRT